MTDQLHGAAAAERNKKAVELYLSSSLSTSAIGERLGLSRSRITAILRDHGVDLSAVRKRYDVGAVGGAGYRIGPRLGREGV